jgi:hypothetical protein
MLVATALTLALIGFVTSTLAALARQNGPKIVAALQGRSNASESSLPAYSVMVRFSPRYTAARPEQLKSSLRVAA